LRGEPKEGWVGRREGGNSAVCEGERGSGVSGVGKKGAGGGGWDGGGGRRVRSVNGHLGDSFETRRKGT